MSVPLTGHGPDPNAINHADHPGRILIVDDERRDRQLLEIMLKSEGHSVLMAANGEEALAMLREHSPDLVLLDVMMPGMDGYQVVARIKAGGHDAEYSRHHHHRPRRQGGAPARPESGRGGLPR